MALFYPHYSTKIPYYYSINIPILVSNIPLIFHSITIPLIGGILLLQSIIVVYYYSINSILLLYLILLVPLIFISNIPPQFSKIWTIHRMSSTPRKNLPWNSWNSFQYSPRVFFPTSTPRKLPGTSALVPVSSSSISRRQVGRRRRRGMAGLSSGVAVHQVHRKIGENFLDIHPIWEKHLGEIWGYKSWLVVQHFTILKNDGVSSSMGSGWHPIYEIYWVIHGRRGIQTWLPSGYVKIATENCHRNNS